MKRRPHVLWLVYILKRFWPLLLVSGARLIYLYIRGEALWVLRWDIAVVAGLCLWSFWRWCSCSYTVDTQVQVKKGHLFRKQQCVPLDCASAVGIERTPLMALFRGRRVWFYTSGGKHGDRLSLFLPRESALQFWPRDDTAHRVRRFWRTLVLATSASNAAVGLVTIAVPLRQAARLLGDRSTGELYTLADKLLTLALPPFLKTGILLLLIGWGVGFIRNLLRYAGFSVTTDAQGLCVRSGRPVRQDMWISRQDITALELYQTLPMRLCKLYSAAVTVRGCKKRTRAHPVIVPAAGKQALREEMGRLLPEPWPKAVTVSPGRTGRRRYLLTPFLWTAAGVLPLCLGGMWRPLTVLWLAVGLWWLCVRFVGWRIAGVAVTKTHLLLRYPRGLKLYTVCVRRPAADAVVLRQSPWQKRSGYCNLEIQVSGSRPYRVWALPIERVRTLLLEEMGIKE